MADQIRDLLHLLSPSRTRVVELLQRRGTATVQDAADALGLGETTVRQHFDRLLKAGIVDHESVSDGPGRPTLHYRLTPIGEQLFPSQNSALFGRLLRFVIREGHPDLVDRFFRATWDERRAEFDQRVHAAGASTLEDRLKVLGKFLEEQGFVPEVHIDGDHVTIRECNCPLSEGVNTTRLPCRLEAEFLEHALEHELTRVSYIPDGHATCTYEFWTGRTGDVRDGRSS